jgi:hypothetical protein
MAPKCRRDEELEHEAEEDEDDLEDDETNDDDDGGAAHEHPAHDRWRGGRSASTAEMFPCMVMRRVAGATGVLEAVRRAVTLKEAAIGSKAR